YAAAGRTQEAIKLREETLQLRRAKLGPDHTDTLKAMKNLANSYADAGRDQEALKLRQELVQLGRTKLGPDHPESLQTMNDLANSYIAVGEEAKAVAVLQETLSLRDHRAKAEPGNLMEQSFIAFTFGQLGEAEQVGMNLAAALRAFATSVELFEKLEQAGSLKDQFFLNALRNYRQRLALCRKAERATKDLDFALQQPAAEVPALLDLRVRFLLRAQNLTAAVESAAMMKERAGDKLEQLYDAACEYALCAGAAKQIKNPDAGATGFENLAKEAITLLRQAVSMGYKEAAHMKQDKDLAALRNRQDFQMLVAELEARNKD
ncbi:MAG TPA: tetratricopeptide repeat protein, partial [Gemmataceae bacterium]|nr:tetratricopeptide repeat protein [Gemmataceae bacterium]